MTLQITFEIQFLMLFQKVKLKRAHENVDRSNSKNMNTNKTISIMQMYNDWHNI